MAQTKAAEINNISIKLGQSPDKVNVFNDFSFDIKENEIVTLLGPSGCGKSTLANILAGYLKPDRGSVLINSKRVEHPGKQCIVIQQENDVFDWLTVHQNMELATTDNDLIDKYLNLVHLDDYKNLRSYALSGGMKKRLSFARALSAKPNFIILDEAFSSLDYSLRHKLYDELLSITRLEHKTLLLITHDIEEAIYLSDRIVVMSKKPVKIIKEVDLKKLRSKSKDNFFGSKEYFSLLTELRGVQTK